IICSPMTSLKTSIKTITYLSDTGCLEIQGASLTPSAINSELYTKMIYLTRNWSLYPNGDGCVTISSPEIKNKYPAAICLALGFFISIVISVMFCLVKKMVDEYQQNSGQ
ncbi:hypothetical protein ACVTNA_27130, partial [Escherichia coli]